MFSAVFVFLVFSILKVTNKSRKNYIKNQRRRTFRNHQDIAGGDPSGPEAPWWRGQEWGRARGPPGPLVAPLTPSFGLYIAHAEEIPNIEVIFPEAIPISAAIET